MLDIAEAKPKKGQLALAEKLKNKGSERYLHKTSGNKPMKKTVRSVNKGEDAAEAVVSGESDSNMNIFPFMLGFLSQACWTISTSATKEKMIPWLLLWCLVLRSLPGEFKLSCLRPRRLQTREARSSPSPSPTS